MPFREKSAWFIAIGLTCTFGVFYAAMAAGLVDSHGMGALHLLIHAVLAFALLQVVLHVVARLQAPKEAGAPPDERERLILLRAARNAGLVLAIGVLAIPPSLHIAYLNSSQMAYALIFAFIVSEFVRAVSKIVYYRRGY